MKPQLAVLQVLVRSMEKELKLPEFEQSIYDFLSIFEYNNYLSKEIESTVNDFLLPLLIYSFYNDNGKNLSLYCKKNPIKNLLKNYPELENRLSLFLKNVYSDCKSIVNLTGKEEIKILGDIHTGNTTKYLQGEYVYYKNYPDYHPVLKSIFHYLPSLTNYYPNIAKLNEYFQREYIHVEKEGTNVSISQYYYNLGYIIPFLLLIRNTDSNQENLIINLPFPKFFDMECVFLPRLKNSKYSINGSGLLRTGEEDRSAITGSLMPVKSILKPVLLGTLEKPYIKWIMPSKGEYDNIPYMDSKICSPKEFLKFLEEGFAKGSEDIFSNLDSIKKVVLNTPMTFRIVLRPTKVYRYVLLKSMYPQWYNESADIKAQIKEDLYSFSNILKLKNSGNILDDEIDSLYRCCIPTYYSDGCSTSIYNASGEVVGKVVESPFAYWSRYIDNVYSRDFLKEQLQIIRNTLSMSN